jgi:RsiW-degrading membrane proteinase PrsW (M82 family)
VLNTSPLTIYRLVEVSARGFFMGKYNVIEAAFIGTLIPMLFLLVILRHSRPVISVFCWGMISFMLGYYLNNTLISILGITDFLTISLFVTPLVEEFLKMLPLFYFLFFAQDSFLPFIYIFGFSSGIGFAVEENLLYLISHHTQIVSSLLYMVVRSMSTCLMHGLCTALIGFIFTYIRKNTIGYWFIPFGYILAVILHSSYNYLVNSVFTAIGILLAFILYLSFAIIMRYLAEQMPEAKNISWQNK